MRTCTSVDILMTIPGIGKETARKIHGIWTGKHWHRWLFKSDYALARAAIAELLGLSLHYLGHYKSCHLEGEAYCLYRGQDDAPTLIFIGEKIKVMSPAKLAMSGHLTLSGDRLLRKAA